jgi:transcriptional regulator with XRE-family HTH domain
VFKNKQANGRLNLSGLAIRAQRKSMDISQRILADRLQLCGLDLGKNAIQQIESGERFVADIEIKAFADFFGVTADSLLE